MSQANGQIHALCMAQFNLFTPDLVAGLQQQAIHRKDEA